jgi:beta-lactamase class A
MLLLVSNLGWFIRNNAAGSERPSSEELQQSYPLLSKRVLADNPNDIIINFVPLRTQIETQLSALGVPFSFYFEYLPSGTSIRAGDEKALVAASLIKVPIVMNLYKAAELGLISLDTKATVLQADVDDGYGTLWQKTGTTLTLREAAGLALRESDNTAARVILRHINGLLREDQQSMSALGIDYDMTENQAIISAKSYSSVLKCLYLACFVNRDSSQTILRDLTHSTYRNRIAKPLPADIPVAHKIGTFSEDTQSDCGIVYVPKRQYVLCIMVNTDSEQGDALMADISGEVYDFIRRQP